MNAVKVTGHVDANHQLSAKVPATVPPGPVTVLIVPMPRKTRRELPGWLVLRRNGQTN